MDDKWYYGHGEERLGPVSIDELRRLVASHQLRAEDLVWRKGFEEWTPAGQVEGLFLPPPFPLRGSPGSPPSTGGSVGFATDVMRQPGTTSPVPANQMPRLAQTTPAQAYTGVHHRPPQEAQPASSSRGSRIASMVLGIVGAVLGLPSAVCSGACAAGLTAATQPGSHDADSAGNMFLVLGLVGALLAFVGAITVMSKPKRGFIWLLAATVFVGVTAVSANPLAIFVTLLLLLATLFGFLAKPKIPRGTQQG